MKWSKWFLSAIAVAAVVAFSSCGDDDGHASVPARPSGENEADSIAIAQISWQKREIRDGVVSKTAQVQKLFDYPQTISMLEIDLNKADVSFVVSYEVSLSKTTSDRAIAANALAAINGTFFNTSTGVSRHFLKCNGTVVATTETNEFSTRATGAFCATGDRVEIITSPSAQPSALWLSSAVTSKARSKIRQYLKGLRSQECVLIGRRLLQNALKSGLRLNEIPKETLDNVLKEFKEPDLNALLVDIALGNLMTVLVAKKLQSDLDVPAEEGLPITGTGGLPYTFAQCCLPIPGDQIIAHVSPGKGLVIHNVNCSNIRDKQKDADKFVTVDWDRAVTASMEFQTGLRIELENRQGILSEISNAVDVAGSRIESINSDIKDESTYIINLTVTVRDRLHLAGVIRRIKAVPNVLRIYRRR